MGSDLADLQEEISKSENSDSTKPADMAKKCENANSIVSLWNNDGSIIQAKVSTLSLYDVSNFVHNFQDPEWIKENSFINDEDGTVLIHIDLASSDLKQLINHFQLCSLREILGDVELKRLEWNPDVVCGTNKSYERVQWLMEDQDLTESDAQKQVMREFPESFKQKILYDRHTISVSQVQFKYKFFSFVSEQFSGYEHNILHENLKEEKKKGALDDQNILHENLKIGSKMLSCQNEEEYLLNWIKEEKKKGTMDLLYRASRDGWYASDLLHNCAKEIEEETTVMIVKSSEGCIFGLYMDASLEFDNAFLFGLKCHQSEDFFEHPPVKMKMKSHMLKLSYSRKNIATNIGPASSTMTFDIIIGDATAAPSLSPKSYLDDFDFYPFVDSGGNDIGHQGGGIDAVAERCSTDPTCKGFNSNGWMKHTLLHQSKWSTWTNDASKGFYVKKGSLPESYGPIFTFCPRTSNELFDLCIGSSCDPDSWLGEGFTNLGPDSCFQMPALANEKFLTGHTGKDDPFEVVELEIFKVY